MSKGIIVVGGTEEEHYNLLGKDRLHPIINVYPEENDIYNKLDSLLGLSGNFWLVSFKISYLCLPLFYETRTTPSCHPSGCAYRQL